MSKRHSIRRIVIVILLFIAGNIIYFKYYSPKIQPLSSGCFVKQTEKIVRGDSMEPMLKDGDKIFLLENYYQCYPVQKGDIIAYNYGGSSDPIIKIVRASSADKLEIVDKQLKIDDDIIKNSAGAAYVFFEPQIRMLGLYIKDGHIPKDSFLIFGDNVNQSADSRRFGAVSANDFLGKFIKN